MGAPFFGAPRLHDDVYVVRNIRSKQFVHVFARGARLRFQIRAAEVEEDAPRAFLSHRRFRKRFALSDAFRTLLAAAGTPAEKQQQSGYGYGDDKQ